MKKLLAVGVIVLFLGLAIAPSINANISKASIDSELVEITTEICGINGVTPNTVSLSKEDAEEVEKLIDDIKSRLDNVETREKTVEIFNEVIIELDRYGLLGDTSVDEAQKIINIGYKLSKSRGLFRNKNFKSILMSEEQWINENCLLIAFGKIFMAEACFLYLLIIWSLITYNNPVLLWLLYDYNPFKLIFLGATLSPKGVYSFSIGKKGTIIGNNTGLGLIGFIGLKLSIRPREGNTLLLGFALYASSANFDKFVRMERV